MWSDPFHSYHFDHQISGEIRISDSLGIPIGFFENVLGRDCLEIQDALHQRVGEIKSEEGKFTHYDSLNQVQGFFHGNQSGGIDHRTPLGFNDYSIKVNGDISDFLGRPIAYAEGNQNGVTIHANLGVTQDEYVEIDFQVDSSMNSQKKPKKLTDWDPKLVQHQLDRQAMSVLDKIPGISIIADKMFEYGTARSEAIKLAGSGIRITERQIPSIHQILLDTCSVLNIATPPKLYLMPGGINAYTFLADEPYVVLNSGLVSCFTEDEIRFTLGHELGHLLLGHVKYSFMARELQFVLEMISQASFGLGGLAGSTVQLAILEWSRKAELSCDRIGLLAVQDGGAAAITALMKMAGAPPKLYQYLDIQAFLEQSLEFSKIDEKLVSGLYKGIATAQMDHPWSIGRASELVKWIELGGPDAAINGLPCPQKSVDTGLLVIERICPKCQSSRDPEASMCWTRGCRDKTPFDDCPKKENS